MTRDKAGKWHGEWHKKRVYFGNVNRIDIITHRLKFRKEAKSMMISSREKSGPSHTDSCYSTFAQCRVFDNICLGNKAAARLTLDALIVSADVSEKNRRSLGWAMPASPLSFKRWGKAGKPQQSQAALSSSTQQGPFVPLLKPDRGGWQVM